MRSAKPEGGARGRRTREVIRENADANATSHRKFKDSVFPRMTIRFEDRVLARPTSMHGAASWFRRNDEWRGFAEIFVDGTPATTEQKDTVTGNFRPYLDQL
mgnify:FL=1